MPDEKKTVEIEKPPPWAIKLTERVSNGFQAVNARLDTMEANIDLQADTTRDVAKRMTSLEERQNALETRQATQSLRAKTNSQADLKHDAAIADLVTKTDALAAQTATSLAILERLDKIARDPMVKRVGKAAALAVWVALTLWLSSHGHPQVTESAAPAVHVEQAR